MCAEAYRENFLTLLMQLVIRKPETKHQQLICAYYELQMSQLCSTISPTLITNSAHMRLISYYRWTKAYLSRILHSRYSSRPLQCLRYVFLKAASDLTSSLCECERPIDGGSTASGSRQEMPLIRGRAMAQRQLIKRPFMCYRSPSGVRIYPIAWYQAPVHDANRKTVGS